MNDDLRPDLRPERTRVTDLADWRRREVPTADVLRSITFVFAGVHYGTVPVAMPYTPGKPIVLYLVPGCDSGGDMRGPLDCLLTDDATLGADRSGLEAAR